MPRLLPVALPSRWVALWAARPFRGGLRESCAATGAGAGWPRPDDSGSPSLKRWGTRTAAVRAPTPESAWDTRTTAAARHRWTTRWWEGRGSAKRPERPTHIFAGGP